MKRSYASWLTAIATIIAAIAALGAWLLPKEATSQVEIVASEPPSQAPEGAVEKGNAMPPKSKGQPKGTARVVEQSTELKDRSEGPPWEFELLDNEQKVILSGRASIAVQFNNVSREEFPTVRLSVGDESTPYPILGAGKRIQFECGDRSYYVSVIAINETDKVVRLRVDAQSVSHPLPPAGRLPKAD